MPRILSLTVLCLLASLTFSSPARADTILLTGGFVEFAVVGAGNSSGAFELTGERRFTFAGFHRAFFAPPIGDPLAPGSLVDLDAKALGLDFTGTATLDGVTYPDVGGLVSPTGASFQLTSGVRLPAVVSAPAVLTAPFLLNLDFFVPGGPHALFGSGLATFTFGEEVGLGGAPAWRLTAARAELSSAPIPEPSTVLLLGSSMGLVLARARRRRAPSSRATG